MDSVALASLKRGMDSLDKVIKDSALRINQGFDRNKVEVIGADGKPIDYSKNPIPPPPPNQSKLSDDNILPPQHHHSRK